MSKQRICRPVILYNRVLPPAKTVEKWKYCAWGIWDGIDVERNIASNEKPVLGEIWGYQKEFCRQLKGQYTAHIIYAMKYDDIAYDEDFWSEKQDKAYPFTFFVKMQLKGNVERLWKDRTDLQKRIGLQDGIIVNTYLVYDNFDLLIAIKARSYEAGADAIYGLYQEGSLVLESGRRYVVKNSFSVFAMKQDIINKLEEYHIAGAVEEADIRIIERQGGGSAAIEKELKSCHKSILNNDNCTRKQILGEEDEIISFRQIPWSVFLSFYKDEEGIINNTNEYYQKYLLGTITTIARKAPAWPAEITEYKAESEPEEKVYSQYIEKMLERLKGIRENQNIDWGKELDVIVNALSKFRQPVFSDYVFLTIMRPLDCLLDLSLKTAQMGKSVVIENRQYIFDFIKNLNMYAQNVIGSDRGFIQTMDGDGKAYAIPVKLNAFCNAYIFQICKLLNRPINEEGKKEENARFIEYNFWAVPGITDRVRVKEVCWRICKERRLIRVEIPEHEYYDLQRMMIILSHEVAHYVGRGIRERKWRYKSFLRAIAHVYIYYVRQQYYVHMNEYPYNSDISARLEERMASLLEIVLEREENEKYLEEKNDLQYKEEAVVEIARKENEEYKYYISFIHKYITGAMASIAELGMENIFAPVLYRMQDEEKKEFLINLDEITYGFIYKYEEGSTLLSLSTMVERLTMVYEECFADLMSILLLQMTPYDYFKGLLKEGLEQGILPEDAASYDYTFRALMVTVCMLRKEKEINILAWSADEVAGAAEYEECGDFVAEIALLYQKYYVKEERIYHTKEYDRNCVNVFKDKQIIENIVDYLRRCRKKYFMMEEEYQDDKRGTEMTRMIRSLYRHSQDDGDGKGLEFQMMEQQEFIEEYKKDLFRSDIRKRK